MPNSLIGALAFAALPSALAFRNTSPFFLFSTADVLIPSSSSPLTDASSLNADVLAALSSCPTRNYVVVEQPGVQASDYADARRAPRLAHYMTAHHAGVRSAVSVPDVVGQLDVDALQAALEAHCAPSDDGWFARLSAPAPRTTTAQRDADLKEQDDILEETIADKMGGSSYTVIFTTSPPTESQAQRQLDAETHSYEMESPLDTGAVQMELKRDLTAHVRRAAAAASDEGGLFERYQYFTPGLFMGFTAIIPLFFILLVGIRALTSLEVSYFAFSKEMGPNAQKKQQQQ